MTLEKMDPRILFGAQGRFLHMIEEGLRVKVHNRGDKVAITGSPEDADRGITLLRKMMTLLERDTSMTEQDLNYLIELLRKNQFAGADEILTGDVIAATKRVLVRPKTVGQHRYVEAIENNDLVFSIGPAGTGKTYLAVAMAVNYLTRRLVDRIVLVRPAVEAGESLGFLPGDLREKVNPYLRPLYDALQEMLAEGKLGRFIEQGIIEIAPLAYMRGRTLNNSFIIMDEAQNSTALQMKMFLTRLGFNSKCVVTGDITQIDLKSGQKSGLIEVQSLLNEIKGIHFAYLTDVDVVRHRLVAAIIRAYDAAGAKS